MPQKVVSDIDKSTVRDLMGTELIKKNENTKHRYVRRDRVDSFLSDGYKVIKDNPQSDVVLVGKEVEQKPVAKPVAKKGK